MGETMNQAQTLQPGQIRVLCLKPGAYGSPLEGHFDTVALTSMTHDEGYEAVSYAWGSRIFDHELLVESFGKIAITRTLYQALQRLRPTMAWNWRRRLWVDFICIDQYSTAERSSQVAMMGQIFSLAFSVLVWLGESDTVGARAFATINLCPPLDDDISWDIESTLHMANAVETLLSNVDNQLVASPHCPCCRISFETTSNTAKDGLREAKDLLRCSWFTRLWVVQEVVVNSNVFIVSGSHWAPWPYFASALARLRRSENELSADRFWVNSWESWAESAFAQIQHFDGFIRLWDRSRANAATLLGSIMELSARDCYEPRDRIYAIRSINGLEGTDDFLPDYDMELGVLYRNLCVRALTDKTWRQPLNTDVSLVLGLTGTESPMAAELNRPSWVPHLHHLTKRSRAKARLYNFTEAEHWPQFASTSYGLASWWSSDDPQSLTVKARCFSVIVDVLLDSQCPYGYPEDEEGYSTAASRDRVSALVQWYLRCTDWVSKRATESMEFAGLMCAEYGYKPENDLKLQLDLATFREFSSEFQLSDEVLRVVWQDLTAYLSHGLNLLVDCGRTLAEFDVAGKRYFGWIPPQASYHDIICIIPGAPWPLALRARSDGCFSLLGDVYIEGIDAFQALQCPPLNSKLESLFKKTLQPSIPREAFPMDMRDFFDGQDPFKFSDFTPEGISEYRRSASRLDSFVESIDWLTLR